MHLNLRPEVDIELLIIRRMIDYFYICVPEEVNSKDLDQFLAKIQSSVSKLNFEDKEKILIIVQYIKSKANSQISSVLAGYENTVIDIANRVLRSKDYCYNRIELTDQDGTLIEVQYYRSMSLDLNNDHSSVSRTLA